MSAQDKFNYYIAQVDKELSKYPTLNKLESQTSVPKAYGAIGILLTFGTFIFFNVWAGFLSNLLGWALPTYFSLRALDSPQTGDDTQWLTYWVVFGSLTLFEQLINIVYWFPFYYTFKTLFILYLILPQTQGAATIYHKALKPLVHNAKGQAQSAPATAPTASTGLN